jgi:hypothetical protein
MAATVAAALFPALLSGTVAASARAPAAAGAGAPASAGTWGKAQRVPGLPLNTGNAETASVSCPSAGNCDAGGFYTDKARHFQAFVVNEVNGVWGKAQEVAAALNTGRQARVSSVSCASTGDCSAGGQYKDGSDHYQAFAISEVNGTWGKAREVPGTAALNAGGSAETISVSCASPGNCSATGDYVNASGRTKTFVVSQKNGTWGTAFEIPGLAVLSVGGNAAVDEVSCGSAGNCAVGGSYSNNNISGPDQAFIASQRSGVWGQVREVPGTAALNAGGSAETISVSCAATGNCGAGGFYTDGSGRQQAFVVSQKNGVWGAAREVPGTAGLNAGGSAFALSVSCASAGNCGAGGWYTDKAGHSQAFVVSQKNGVWGKALEVPGTAALNADGLAMTNALSCASAGNCSAGGVYYDSGANNQAFVVSEVNGAWGKALKVPGSAALNTGAFASVFSVSCASAGNCGAGGEYQNASGVYQAFVVGQTG